MKDCGTVKEKEVKAKESKAKDAKPDASEPEPPMRRYKTWLGHWKDDYDNITNVIELVLQAGF